MMLMRRALLVCLAACGGDDGGAPGDPSAHQFCVQETNRYRSMNGKAALTESMQLETYADTGAMVDFGSSPHSHFTKHARRRHRVRRERVPEVGP